MYLPMALLAIAAAIGIDSVCCASRRWGRVVAASAVGAAVALGLVSRAESTDWHDSVSLWSELAETYPDEPRFLMRVGDALLYQGQSDGALAVYQRLREQYPTFGSPRAAHAAILESRGQASAAEQLLAEGVRTSQTRSMREEYAFFLLRHGELAPSDVGAARAALVELAPVLAARGKRAPTIRRAIELLGGMGETELVEQLNGRLAELAARAGNAD
jgi:hypothetical protein